MKPRTKLVLKVLACHWLASICMAIYGGLFATTNSHVAYAGFPPFVILIAPVVGFAAALSTPFLIFEVFSPKHWPQAAIQLSYLLPMLIALSLTFKRPRRWYGLAILGQPEKDVKDTGLEKQEETIG